MSNTIAQSRNPPIKNLREYLRLKEIRENTALIGGKIIYAGVAWSKELYEDTFPVPVLQYHTVNPDKKNIAK